MYKLLNIHFHAKWLNEYAATARLLTLVKPAET